MRHPHNTGGYTIIEVMIFLTISSAMFVSVLGVVNSQNRRTQFTESVQTFDQKLRDIINDVDTGYFPSNGDFKCDLDGSGVPVISVGGAGNSVKQGENQDCVYAGKAIQFYPNEGDATNDPSKFRIYTIVGARIKPDKTQVTSVDDANLRTINTAGATGAVDTGALSSGVQVKKVIYSPGSAAAGATGGGVAIISGFGNSATGGSVGLKSGNIRSSFSAVPLSALNETATTFTNKVANIKGTSVTAVSSGALVCLQEAGGGRWASILVGGDSGQNTTKVTIDNVPAECTS